MIIDQIKLGQVYEDFFAKLDSMIILLQVPLSTQPKRNSNSWSILVKL